MSITTKKELKSEVIYYTVHLLSNDVVSKGYDVLFTVRKNYFESKRKKRDRIFLNVEGESVKYSYFIDNNKPLKWVKENESKITQRVSINGSSGYVIETLDYSGAITKKEYFTNNHIYEKTEYYDGFSQSPYKTIMPLITDKVAAFALYVEDTKTPLTLRSVEMPTDNNVLNDLILEVSPELGANTSEGFSYFCSESKEKEWNTLLKKYKEDIKINNRGEEKEDKNEKIFVFNIENLSKETEEVKFDIKKLAQPLSKYKKYENTESSKEEKTEEENEEEIIKEKIEKTEKKYEVNETKETEYSNDSFEEKAKKEEYKNIKEKSADKEITENNKDKNLYYGKLDDNNNRVGYGRTTSSSGKTLYDGEYLNDKQNGFGVSYYKTGRLNYIGNWVNDKKDGFGISVRPTDGCVQVGAFKNDKLEDVTVKFDKTGKMISIENYKKDDLEGAHITVEDNGNMLVTKWEDGRIQKNATILNNNGDLLYTGGVKNNKKEGIGMLFSQEVELLYKGEFREDEYNGKGVLYLEEGITIEGEFKENKVNGKAIKRDENNRVIYSGEYKDSKYDGTGRLYFEDGRYKEGKFKEGQPVGEFILYSKDNEKIYKGEMTGDIYDGKGTIYENELMIYSGAFSNGEKYGIGREYEKGNCVYMGEYENGEKNGFGTKYKNNKAEYVGYFKEGKKNGKGILYAENGYKYVGEFKDDKKDGRINKGEESRVIEERIYKNGECIYKREYTKEGILIYEGNIKNNIREGMGILFNEYSDKEFEGIFKEGKPYKNMKIIGKEIKEIETTDKLNATEYKEYIETPLIAVEIPLKNGIYSGQVDKEKKPDGKGVMLCCDHKYMGMFKDGKPNGEAIIIFDDGEEKRVEVEESKTEETVQIKFTNIIYHIKNRS